MNIPLPFVSKAAMNQTFFSLLRAQRQRTASPQVPHLRVVGNGESISVLDDAAEVDGAHIAEQLREFRKGMG